MFNSKTPKSKFDSTGSLSFNQRVKSICLSLLFLRGRKKGMIHTMNIRFKDVWVIFFPQNFGEKYRYLGTSVWVEDSLYYQALFPLVLALDYEARPKWCPRWFLRFLHLFGSDNSIVRVRNRALHNLEKRLTKGIMFVDWKTKWSSYDLRITIYGPEHLQELAGAIEQRFYSTGRQNELVEDIKKIDPVATIIRGSISRLEKQLEELQTKTD